MYLLPILVLIVPFLTVVMVLSRDEQLAIKKRAITKREEAHIDEEMVIHQALERAGALPKHHHKEGELHKRDWKEVSVYTLGYIIIAVEIWYLYISISQLIGT